MLAYTSSECTFNGNDRSLTYKKGFPASEASMLLGLLDGVACIFEDLK